ncbi:MAG: c-type cytochrome [Bacteroidetes bacterium]|nr:c-type cytochrome [Bacteroidota bacterium]
MTDLRFLLLLGALVTLSLMGCTQFDRDSDDEPPELILPDGFHSEVLYNPMKVDSSSWVSLATDGKGGLFASDQYGALYHVSLPPIGSDPEGTEVVKLDLELGHAQGLLWAFNSLYVVVNSEEGVSGRSSGLYRITDSDGDAVLDSVHTLAQFEGWGEHGPHGIVLGPDGESLYLVAGNHTELPETYDSVVPPVWQTDQLLPSLRDPRGHAADRQPPGGWVVRTDSLASKLELISVGYRNAYDLAFSADGELFTFDSDMEWDLGMPWYRPIRVLHVTSGSEFGWRTGSGKWAEYYPDNLPAVAEIGQGSPTGVVSGKDAAFPRKYRQGLFIFDWSFGTIYHVALKARGSTYTGTVEEFLSGVPLPVTDGVIGDDGALYFATGGRRLNSFLFRVYYDPPVVAVDGSVSQPSPQQVHRRSLEALHVEEPRIEALSIAWPYLNHGDRSVRYAARVAVEHQALESWQSQALSEQDPIRRIHAAIALARHADSSLGPRIFQGLLSINPVELSRAQELDLLRAIGLVMIRMGPPEGELRGELIGRLDRYYPSRDEALNREYGRLLAALQAPGLVDRMMSRLHDLSETGPGQAFLISGEVAERSEQYGEAITEMRANPPSPEEIELVMNLRVQESGWTIEQRKDYFTWFHEAMRRSGGASYVGFLEDIRSDAAELLTEEEVEALAGLVDASPPNQSLADLPQPEGPGRTWNRQELNEMLNDALGEPRDFSQGETMYAAALCGICHRIGTAGGSIGPDLTGIGSRFSRYEILEAIDSPSDEISDQYEATILTTNDNATIVGRILREEDGMVFVNQNPYDPSQELGIDESDVLSREVSPVSTMPSRLLDRLNENEVADLIAYLLSGADPEHKCFTGEEGCQTKDEDE